MTAKRTLAGQIRKAAREGVLWKKTRWYLHCKIERPLEFAALVRRGYGKLPPEDKALSVENGFADHRSRSDARHADPEHLRRLIAAYKAARAALPTAPEPYQIRGLWKGWIERNYRPLIEALNGSDLTRLAALLENFNREAFTVGLGTGYENFVRYHGLKTRGRYVRVVWCDYRDKLALIDPGLESVRFPLVGNPAGIELNGDVVQIDTLRHVYHALEMRQWLSDTDGATVVEIGGGAGGQAYQALRLGGERIGKYLVFDIPEVAAISAWFLLTALPEKRIRLYGEGPLYGDYDAGVFPHFAITGLADDSVDLFHNSCSFSEMDGISSREYLRVIERCCRRYFAHVNHDHVLTFQNEDGTTSVNVTGSCLIPDPERFKRIYKKPRVFVLPEDIVSRYTAYEYLYERRS